MTRELYGSNHVARHCSAICIKPNGTPHPTAFQLRKNEQFLLVNWLEYFGRANPADNVARVGEDVCKHRFYEDDIASRPKPSGDAESLDYWKDILDMQSNRQPWKTHTAEKITEQITSKKDVPAPIQNILDRLASITEGL